MFIYYFGTALSLSLCWLCVLWAAVELACFFTGFDSRDFDLDCSAADNDGRRNKNAMAPTGSRTSMLKNKVAWCMALIARRKESRKYSASTHAELEAFHVPVDHPFFNESYYFNGADERNQRFITRISRHGRMGGHSYVFLLLDIDGIGILSLEKDDVKSETQHPNPIACGVSYTCEEPMKRWRIRYKGPMRRGCVPPSSSKMKDQFEDVELDLVYERTTPTFWYMRDDDLRTLAKNLSQEPWGYNFFKVCVTRSSHHAHYEEYGRATGTVRVGDSESTFDFGTFRDHSWDIRRWAAMDSLLILLVELAKPLTIDGASYKYLDLTLVSMPGNIGGVQKYTTGYLLGNGHAKILPVTQATSIDTIKWKTRPDGSREPLDRTDVVIEFPASREDGNVPTISVRMDGPIRRLQYWPDHGDFEVFEDAMDFTLKELSSGFECKGYGTRQSGFRVGDFDPSLGGVG